jgi:hypothetical protein
MNFIETFKKGKAGKNLGLSTGIPQLDEAIGGLQKKTSIGLAAAPKCGKTTLADFCFLLMPFLEAILKGTLDNIEWIYFSFEVDRINKEFKFAAFFMFHDYQISGYMYKGKWYDMDSQYLLGKKIHREGSIEERIPMTEEHENMLKEIYANRIVPLFGEYDKYGRVITPGKIKFITERDNPTGMDKYLRAHAKAHGEFVEESYVVSEGDKLIPKKRVIGYTAKNPDKFTIIITDHIRKLRRERGFTMKENIDKWLEYTTDWRNLCEWTFINIVHSGRQLANVERLRYAGETIFPTADDTKDTGNIAEESTILMTLFNANDEKYNLKTHFGHDLSQYPNYRSLHITESRDTECPAHVFLNMFGGVNVFEHINARMKAS